MIPPGLYFHLGSVREAGHSLFTSVGIVLDDGSPNIGLSVCPSHHTLSPEKTVPSWMAFAGPSSISSLVQAVSTAGGSEPFLSQSLLSRFSP